MAHTPQHGFAIDQVSEQVLLSLGLVTQSNALDFHRAFSPITGDSLVAELEASGKIKQTGQREYEMLVDFNKPRNMFTVTGEVAVVDADTVITVEIENYTDEGETLSAPAVGLFFRENSSDIVFEVVAVDKDTPSAHTADIKPVDSRVEAVTISADDAEFISTGRPKVQEASFQQDGEYEGWQGRQNEVSFLRTNKAYTDIASMVKIERRGGVSYYDLDATSITRQHTDVKEMGLIDGDLADSVTSEGNENNNALGLVALVKEYGTALDGGGAGAVLNDAFFTDLSRAIDGTGHANNYRGLAGPEAYYAVQDFLANAGANVQIVVQNGSDDDIRVIFDYDTAFKIKGVNYDFKKYAYWNSARLAGANSVASPKAYQMLLVPQGGVLSPSGEVRDYLTLRYLNNTIGTDEGLLNKMDTDGALFGKNTTRHGQISITSYLGIDATDVESFVFAQLQMP